MDISIYLELRYVQVLRPVADAMAHGELVLPTQYSRRILRFSTLTLFSIASALYNGLFVNATLAIVVFCTSINYWRHPLFGWRRNLDIGCVCIAFSYQISFTATHTSALARHAYYLTMFTGSVCYLASLYAGRILRDDATDSLLHVCLHICGNVGNLLLYDSLGANTFGLGSDSLSRRHSNQS